MAHLKQINDSKSDTEQTNSNEHKQAQFNRFPVNKTNVHKQQSSNYHQRRNSYNQHNNYRHHHHYNNNKRGKSLKQRSYHSKRYRNVNEQKQFIFIHVPKTGGSSIERMLFDRSMDSEHKLLSDYRRTYRYREYFKFAFVRNPYFRTISMFIYFKSGGNQKHDLWKICTLFEKLKNLDHFVDFFQNSDHKWFRTHEFFAHFRQTDYLFDGCCTVDFVGKLEHFEEDFTKLSKLIKVNVDEIAHENYNGDKAKFDELLITPYFVQFINDFMSADFEQFGYKKVKLQKAMTLEQFKIFCNEK